MVFRMSMSVTFQAIVEDLERRQGAVANTKDAVGRMLEEEGQTSTDKQDECK